MNRIVFRLLIVLLACLGVGSLAVWVAGATFFLVTWLKTSSDLDSAAAGPLVRISARYDGAAAREVEDTIILPIEAQLEGIEGVAAVESISRQDGTATVNLYLRPGADSKMVQVLAQNRVALALPVVPQQVQMHGIRVIRTRPLPALWLVLGSPDQSRDLLYLRNFGQTVLVPELQRLPGVEEVSAGPEGGPHPRVWLDPDKLAARSLTAADVERLVREPPGGLDKLMPENVPEMIVKVDAAGQVVRIRDVGVVEMAGADLGLPSRWHGQSAAVIGVYGDPAQLVKAVQDRLPGWRERLPAGTGLSLLPGPATPGTEGLLIDGRLPDAASPERVRRVAEQVAGTLEGFRDTKAEGLVPAVIALPANEPQAFRLYVALCPPADRAWTAAEVGDKTRRVLAEELKDAVIRVTPPSVLGRPPRRRAPVVLLVSGPDFEESVRLANEISDRLPGSGAVANVWPEYARFVPQPYIDVNREKVAQLGVNLTDLMQTLQVYFGPVEGAGGIQVRVGQPGPGGRWKGCGRPTA
jgi:multidrug efflux pump subunit AcrB